MSPTAQKTLFDGVHLADSVTVDAHKQLFTPMGFGMVLYRDENIAQNITKTAQYIIRADSSDLGRFTMEGSRPCIAHYLRANFFILGRDGFASAMDRKMAVTSHLAKWLKAQPDFDLLFDPQADILLCRYVRTDAEFQALDVEERDEALDAFTQQLQTTQSALGRTFTSRTAVFDPRREREARTHFLRIVVNAQIGEEDAIRILKDTRFIAEMLQLGARPLAQAETLVQALAHVALHNPNEVAVKCDAEELSWKELFSRASALRCKMSSSAGSVVPVMAGQGLAAHIAALAVLLGDSACYMMDSGLSAEQYATCLRELGAEEVVVEADQLATLAAVKQQLAGDQGAKLRALTVGMVEPVSTPPCSRPCACADSLAVVVRSSGASELTSSRVHVTHKQLLSAFDESTLSSALDRMVVCSDSIVKVSQN